MRVRDVSFDFTHINPLVWHSNEYIGNFLNSLSVMFPVGEHHFIDAIREHAHLADDDLKKEIEVFYKQEARHTREHKKFNNQLKAYGVDVDGMEERIRKRLSRYKKSPTHKLVSTVLLEEITGAGAHLLKYIDPFVMRGSPEVIALWRYHAEEEREHVHVARKLLKKTNIPKHEITKIAIETTIDFVLQVVYNLERINTIKH